MQPVSPATLAKSLARINASIADRVELTEGLIRDAAVSTSRVPTRGTTLVERVFSLVLLGDLVSVYLAALRGVDPGPVELIEQLKGRLAER